MKLHRTSLVAPSCRAAGPAGGGQTRRVVRTLRPVIAADAAACAALVAALPSHFTPDVPDKVAHDVEHHGGMVLFEDDVLLGCCVVERRGRAAAEVLWLAVAAGRHREGHGTALLGAALAALAADGVSVVEAKTLDASADYAPYVATRAFWAARGFVQVDTIDPLPDWAPGSPAAILVAALRATVD
jgi:GNAT superfamily N-acetyltransferase